MRSIWLSVTRRTVVSARWHFGYLDSLRGIAVLAVVLIHSSMRDNVQIALPSAIRVVTGSGQRGVALFFIVSSFTLFLSHDHRRDESRATLNFFIRRFFRLAPMLYIAMALTYVFLRRAMGGPTAIVANALFVGGFHPSYVNAGTVGGGQWLMKPSSTPACHSSSCAS